MKMAAELLHAIFALSPEARLAQLNAGDKRNALPREAAASIYVRLTLRDPHIDQSCHSSKKTRADLMEVIFYVKSLYSTHS